MSNIIERARKIKKQMSVVAKSFDDDTALAFPEFFKNWAIGATYSADDRLVYMGTLYKVLQPHTSQETWTPDSAPSLYVRVDNPAVEYPEWVQPTGATDAYPINAKVSYSGKHWASSVDHNVWEPGVFGWDEVFGA